MVNDNSIKNQLGKTFLEIAESIESGKFGKRVRVGLTTLGSELGTDNLIKGAELAAKNALFDIVLIGSKTNSNLESIVVEDDCEMHVKMEELLDSGRIDACVTMHYNFPIGVSTVGKAITPGKGAEMYLATTTGTSSSHRTEGMVRNALHGIIAAKAMGNENPTVGILNLDGARQVERALKELDTNGYSINFGESQRADGGIVMRGNDLLSGSVDVMITDSLTGNIMMKVFSSFTSGGSYESLGYGYGPGIGEDYDKIVLILSRASGVPVVANALAYAARLAENNLADISKAEFEKANNANLQAIIKNLKKENHKVSKQQIEFKMPDKEIVTGTISGIDIMDLEDAVTLLLKSGIYAESGMGCTGPIIMINERNIDKGKQLLCKNNYLSI